MNETYLQSRIILIPIAMTFAHTWALNYVSTYDWVRTSWQRKLGRTFIGAIVLAGCIYGRYKFVENDDDFKLVLCQKYIFSFIIPFIIFAFLPIFFKFIGLVKRE